MAVKRGQISKTFWLPAEMMHAIETRARELGFRRQSHYVRAILSRELREPRIPKRIVLFGRAPRDIANHRPKR